jgi:hypothetical protein
MLTRLVRLGVVAFAWIVLGASQVWACPMCKLALEADDPQPRAYMYSILFMLGAMGSIIGGMIGFLWWLSRTERAAMDAAGYQHLFENGVSQPALPVE